MPSGAVTNAFWRVVLVSAALLGLQAGARADGDDVFWRATSDAVVPFVALSELALYGSGSQGQHQAWQGLQALATTAALTEGLKAIVPARRPNGSGLDGFPSLHAAEAFTMATVIDQYKPRYGILAYTAATLIGVARVQLDEHHWQDVLGGAALGYLSGRLFAHHHVMVTPEAVAFNMSF